MHSTKKFDDFLNFSGLLLDLRLVVDVLVGVGWCTLLSRGGLVWCTELLGLSSHWWLLVDLVLGGLHVCLNCINNVLF